MNETMHRGRAKSWWLLVVYALVYGAVMLSFGGTWLYEPSPYHRFQAEALLHGHLYLSDSIDAMQPGLVWHDGHVQHVWGLGIGLWLLPFQAVWHLFGGQAFPDRIALGIAFALLAFFSGGTGLKFVRQGQWNIGLGIIWLVALCPALWTLTRASHLVFEETVLYSVLQSLCILVSLVRVVSFNSRTDYVLCCFLSAFAIWVRPTHAVYGLGAVLIASLAVWRCRHCLKEVMLGIGGWLASLALLAWTNYARFGSPAEFGHHLTISSGSMMYLTRFGNPFREASLFKAVKELFGLLFLTDPLGANAFANNLFLGQAPFTRWRRLDLMAFDPSYAVSCLAAIAGAILWLVWQRRKNVTAIWLQPRGALILSLLMWSSYSTAVLGWFYLYYPAIASRYLFDCAPVFTGFALMLWVLTPIRWNNFARALLAVWLIYEIVSAKVPVQPQLAQNPPIQLALPHTQRVLLEDFNGIYTPDHHPAETKIAGNGYGWEPETGFTADVVSLAIDEPTFVELHVSERRASNGQTALKDVYRAQIDGVSLPLRRVIREGDGLEVTFEIPVRVQNRHQIEILFLCFSDGYNFDNRNSERFLYSVRWR
jgi:hypothetical protein